MMSDALLLCRPRESMDDIGQFSKLDFYGANVLLGVQTEDSSSIRARRKEISLTIRIRL